MSKCVNEDCQYFREHGECSELCMNQGIKKVVTNADYIRSLSDRELAETLLDFLCDFDRSSYEDVWNWLKAEREG